MSQGYCMPGCHTGRVDDFFSAVSPEKDTALRITKLVRAFSFSYKRFIMFCISPFTLHSIHGAGDTAWKETMVITPTKKGKDRQRFTLLYANLQFGKP
jgi:hypothetical protein